MQDDYNNPEVKKGQFVMIDTGDVENEEDSRLYLKGNTEWKFISDLSGAQGIQGLSAYQVATRASFDEFWYIDLLKYGNANTPEDILQNMLYYKGSQEETLTFLPIFDLSNQ